MENINQEQAIKELADTARHEIVCLEKTLNKYKDDTKKEIEDILDKNNDFTQIINATKETSKDLGRQKELEEKFKEYVHKAIYGIFLKTHGEHTTIGELFTVKKGGLYTFKHRNPCFVIGLEDNFNCLINKIPKDTDERTAIKKVHSSLKDWEGVYDEYVAGDNAFRWTPTTKILKKTEAFSITVINEHQPIVMFKENRNRDITLISGYEIIKDAICYAKDKGIVLQILNSDDNYAELKMNTISGSYLGKSIEVNHIENGKKDEYGHKSESSYKEKYALSQIKDEVLELAEAYAKEIREKTERKKEILDELRDATAEYIMVSEI